MKNTLLVKAGVLSATSALMIGVVAMPLVSFASETSAETSVQQHGPRGERWGRGMMNPHGLVTSVYDAGDGTGTITMTLAVREYPQGEQGSNDEIVEKIKEKISAFLEEHPDAPRVGDSVTIAYDSATKFMIGGEEASAADVTAGMSIFVMGAKPGSDETAAVISDAARPPMGERGERGHRPHGVIGEVTSVDTNTNTVTITLPDASDGKFTVGQQVNVRGFMQIGVGSVGSNQ